jgi:hypothetical protein
MRTIQTTIYYFDELNDTAKERAISIVRKGMDYPWFDEAKDSIKAFCKHFGREMVGWSLGDTRGFANTKAVNNKLSTVTPNEVQRDTMPTGYYLDNVLFGTFCDAFKNTGDPEFSFQSALNAAVQSVAEDVDYYCTDKAVQDHIEVNGIEFHSNGTIYQ